MPPSLDKLRKRLEERDTETKESVDRRMKKAPLEIEKCVDFDKLILNDKLPEAFKKAEALLQDFIKK